MKKILFGYTLLELLITLTIIAIIAAVAVPSFDSIMDNNKQSAAINKLLGELHFARSEAVKRARQVVICPSSNNNTCNTAQTWADGWIMFIDNNRNNMHENAEEILRIGEKFDRGLTVTVSHNLAKYIRYRSNGMTISPGEITICDSRGSPKAQAIIINTIGRPQISQYNEVGGALICNQ
ncbi:GspH/FimT family protein [Marinagarivorans algicola]|uniref:GspH/FimT family protein n=1 Tax=Marinagarivorans algicola TaxID=1513270 RepID=UPI0006B5231E|nr:GspH/FimT family protein [Marinagarivorans algicola]